MIYILGPCVIESRDHAMECALAIKEIVGDRDWYFKASYDKANRTSYSSYRGPGVKKGLDILYEVRETVGCKITSDVHSVEEAWEGANLDLVQIPAFLCRQTSILRAAAKSGAAVNIKKGQWLGGEQMKYAVEKVSAETNKPVWLTERGTCLGYGDLVVDFRNIQIMKQFAPVIFDATHSVQKPGGATTGGAREFVPNLVKAAKAVEVDGLFIECHPDPDKALSDAGTQWPISRLSELL